MNIKREIERVVEELIQPAIRSHGGNLEIVGYRDHVLQISLTGACANCPMANIDTKREIEKALKEVFPTLEGVELVDSIESEMLRLVRSILRDDKKYTGKAVKYCGGCNPTYDRTAVVQRLEEKLGEKLETAEAGKQYEEIYVVCGCSTHCVDISELKADHVVVIDGGSLERFL